MLRSILIYLSKAAWARRMVTGWSFAWRAASRFVAGEKLEDAFEAVKKLNEKGINATLDFLGEHTQNPEEADKATAEIIKILQSIGQTGLRSNVSVKLSQIGLALEEELCKQNLKRILEIARDNASFVRIDIEDSPWVDLTLKLYREMRLDFNLRCVGQAIQAYLYRSIDDVARLMEIGARIRLCKGAYKEPADIAYPKKNDVDTNYDKIARLLMDKALEAGGPIISEDGKIPPIPALATHDENRIKAAINYAQKIGLPKKALEFQMLNGIRRDLQESLAAQGYPVRIYVPYGTEWYPYFTRRLAERPANLWFFVSNFFRK